LPGDRAVVEGTALLSTTALSLGKLPSPISHPLLFVIPSGGRGICSFLSLGYGCVGDCQGLIELVKGEVDFLLLDDQGAGAMTKWLIQAWMEDTALHHLGGYSVHDGWLSVDFILLGVERGFVFPGPSPSPMPRRDPGHALLPIEGCFGLSALSFSLMYLPISRARGSPGRGASASLMAATAGAKVMGCASYVCPWEKKWSSK